MSFDPDQCMKIRASGKCDEGWWFFSSKNPVIVSGLQETIQEAQGKYEELLKDYLLKKWNIQPDQIIKYETKTTAKHVLFADPENIHTAYVEPDDIRMTIVYCIQEQKNRTLDEFETAVNDLKKTLNDNEMTMEVSLSSGASEISQKVKQIADLASYPAGEEA